MEFDLNGIPYLLGERAIEKEMVVAFTSLTQTTLQRNVHTKWHKSISSTMLIAAVSLSKICTPCMQLWAMLLLYAFSCIVVCCYCWCYSAVNCFARAVLVCCPCSWLLLLICCCCWLWLIYSGNLSYFANPTGDVTTCCCSAKSTVISLLFCLSTVGPAAADMLLPWFLNWSTSYFA